MTPYATSILVILLVLPLAMFFSFAIHALRHASWIRLEDAFNEIDKPHRFIALRDDFDRFMTAMEILRLLCDMTIISALFFTLSSPDSYSLTFFNALQATLICTLLLCLFTVIIPNIVAHRASTTILVKGYFLIRLAELILKPIILFFHLIERFGSQIVGMVDDDNDNTDERQERLLSVMEEGEQRGVVDEEEKEMIVSVLEFRETTAGEIMTPRTDIVGIPIQATHQEIIELFKQNGFSRYPVYDQSIDNIVAVLYSKDLLAWVGMPDDQFDINKLLRKPLFVPDSKYLRDLLHDFQNQKIHIAVVLDEYGGTAGVVTFEDILEELVGDIVDEHEHPRQEMMIDLGNSAYEVDARCSVDELNDKYDLDLPEDEDYETVGGFVFAQLGHIPETGESFTYKSLQLTVLSAQLRKIDRIKIEKLKKTSHSAG